MSAFKDTEKKASERIADTEMKASERKLRDNDFVHQFLACHLLHWLEALGLLGWISESIGMMDDLLGLLDVCSSTLYIIS